MNKDFIPFKEALELKNLGYDIEIESDNIYFYSWGNVAKSNQKYMSIGERLNIYRDTDETGSFYPWVTSQNKCGSMEDHFISAPLYQEAFRWFREKYNYMSYIKGRKSMGFDYTLTDVPSNKSKNDTIFSFDVYTTYEEAELACIKALIEIVKKIKK